MDSPSTPVKKKPKTLPKPILDLNNSPSSGNKDVKPLERLIPSRIESEKHAASNNMGKSFQAVGQKPPLLPKPMNLKKTTFSPPHRQHHKLLTTSEDTVNSNVCTIVDYRITTLTEVTHRDVDTSLTNKKNSSVYIQNENCTDQNNYKKDKNKLEEIFSLDKLFSQAEDSKNLCVDPIVEELKPIISESHIVSLVENHKIFSNEENDNIENPQTDVERIVANTWAALQEDNGMFLKCVNIKSNAEYNLSSNYSDRSNLNVKSNPLIKNTTTLYGSPQDEGKPCESGMNKTQTSSSISELVRALHTVKVEHSSENEKTVSDTSNESFLHSLKAEKLIEIDKLKDGTEGINNIFVEQFDTSTPKLPKECSGDPLDYNLDAVIIRKKEKLEEHNRSTSWSEGTGSLHSRSNSIGSGSYEGSTSVRQRISSWFGSFGKGNKHKEARESLFYCDNPELDVSTVNQNKDITISCSSLNDTNELKLGDSSKSSFLNVPQYGSSNFDDDSNRSSVSEESFDVKHMTKLETENKSSSLVQTTVQDVTEKKKQKCFFIANELVSSEKVFIDVLKLLCQDFKAFVEDIDRVQKSPMIPSNELNRITNSLPQLLSLNEDLLRDLESRVDSWNELPKIADVIVKKGPFLKLYSTYIQNFQAQTDYLDECCQKYPRFMKAVKDFEASDRCKKLALKHYMLKPIQRIPQYRLLLEDYLEHQEEGSVDYADTQTALQIVSDVASHANKSIKQGDHLSKLLSIQSQLGNYEIIKPGREFVMEGELYKLSRKEMQLRFFILLSDCLLYTSYYGSMTGLRVKYKLPLCGMKVNPTHDKDSPTEFSIITSTRSFTLRAKSEEECEAWLNALQNAIKQNNCRQMTFLNMNFVPMNAAEGPLKLGREAPVWIPDKRVTMCQVCTAEFTLTFRRHHCRACGKVVCGECSDYRAPLQYKELKPCRVCEDCFEYLLKELDDISAKVHDVVKDDFTIVNNSDLTNMVDQIRCSFKKPGPSSGKKVRKYIPQRLKEVTAKDSGSQMSGWLYRRYRRSWKRLWFVLKEQVLYVYKASEDVVALESIPVLGYTVDMFKEGEYEECIGDCKFVFQLTHAGQCPFVFSTDTQHSAERWISAIKEATLLK